MDASGDEGARGKRRSMRKGGKNEKMAALEEMKQYRELGLKRSDHYEVEEDEAYDYMNEEEYQEHLKKQKEQGGFVVDDDGTGYIDNYDDDSEMRDIMESGDIASLKRRTMGKEKTSRSRKNNLEDPAGAKNQKLASMFTKMLSGGATMKNSVGPKSSTTRAENLAEASMKEDESLDDMLSDLVSSSASNKKTKSLKKKRKVKLKSSKKKRVKTYSKLPVAEQDDEEEPEEDTHVELNLSEPEDQMDTIEDKVAVKEEHEEEKKEAVKGEHEEEKKEVEKKPVNMKSKLFSAARAKPTKVAPVAAPTTPVASSKDAKVTFMTTPTLMDCGPDESGWAPVAAEAKAETDEVATSTTGKTPKVETDADGNSYIDVFWLDIHEDYYNIKGTLFLIGKVWCETSKAFVSISVEINNLMRVLHVLPREELREEDGGGEVDFMDCVNEMKRIVYNVLPVDKNGERALKLRPANLKYAFELPDVPREETKYLELHYPMCAESDRLDPELEGRSFKRVFGTHQTATERFLLSRDLMGPCWIRITGAKFPEASKSWCKYHAQLDNPNKVVELKKALLAKAVKDEVVKIPPPPKLRIMSLSLKTLVNERTHQHEVMVVSGLIRDNVDLVSATPDFDKQKFVQVFSIVRSGGGDTTLPLGFREFAKKKASQVMLQNNERALLSFLLVQMQKYDPDVIIGHNVKQFEMDVLLSRMKANNVGAWSKLGRLRLYRMPQKRTDGDGYFGTQSLVPGRLLLDTYTTAKELLLGQRNYSLTELCRTQLGRKRAEVQPIMVPDLYTTKESLLKLISLTEADAWLTMQLSFKLEALPLTMQLTNLGGNLWSRTLNGGRAERIEYLLLHEFTRQGYIVPDKTVKYNPNKSWNKKNKKNKGKGGGTKQQQQPVSKSASRKPKYDGGLVLEPKKGLYDKYILLLDFNSLYPSIIQEYNICYTTVERTVESRRPEVPKLMDVDEEDVMERNQVVNDEDLENDLPALPDRTLYPDLAVLPSLIKALVERRRAVKQQLKSEKNPATRAQLDVRQKALKLTANSMYGCLGFTGFRFFAKPVAALVTSQGRAILQNTVDITQNNLGYEVVYGDTDSIMVNTNTQDLEVVKTIGQRIKKEINKLYNLLEIEQDGIFKTMLLLKKKKYAALLVREVRDAKGGVTIETDKETKGLDLVRRDWCSLSKRVGHAVLDHILSGKAYDDIVEGIHECLDEVKVQIDEKKVALEEFIITKGLNKSPKDYPDAKSQPHLRVALAMLEQGKPVNTGDHIPYVICTITREEYKKKMDQFKADGVVKDDDSRVKPKSSYADRAFHPNELKLAPAGVLEIDIDWYLKQQIVPPTQRLCDPIEGTSAALIAEHLGLDPSAFQHSYSNGDDEDDLLNLVDVSDVEKYKMCQKLGIRCQHCALEYPFPGPVLVPSDANKLLAGAITPVGEGKRTKVDNMQQALSGLACPRCDAEVNLTFLGNLLHLASRAAVEKYYQGWFNADDPSIELHTRQQSVIGRAFVVNGRRVQLRQEFGSTALYTQLKYYESLVNVDRALEQLEKKNVRLQDKIKAPLGLNPQIREELSEIQVKLKQSFVENSAYNWVEPSLFTRAFGLQNK